MRATLIGKVADGGAAAGTFTAQLGIDGVLAVANGGVRSVSLPAAYSGFLNPQWLFLPLAGSHLIAPYASSDIGAAMLVADDGSANIVWLIEEIVTQNASNGTV